MPIAAVPAYLGHDFREASPGMRFGMYLKLWGINRRSHALLWKTHDIDYKISGQQQQEREFADENKVSALNEAKGLSKRDKHTLQSLAARQTALAATVAADRLLRLDAIATSPFTTGLGNEHPLENGFAFLNPYGLPYLPGSGVKGVLRQAARELASGDWGETHGWDGTPAYEITIDRKPIRLSMLDVLFGRASADGDTEHVRGVLTFWDVIPQVKGDSLMVEIMTPHQGHYYQQKEAAGSTSPHDSGQPIPISYLTVPPGSGFAFHVVCDLAFLGRTAPALTKSWKALLTSAFEHAFRWLGFGAKTAVGYGAMQADQEAAAKASKAREELEAEAERARLESERKARLAALTPNLCRVEEFREQAEWRKNQLGNNKDKPNTQLHTLAQQLVNAALEDTSWTAEEKRALADAIEEWLPRLIERFDKKDDWKEARKKLKLAALRGES